MSFGNSKKKTAKKKSTAKYAKPKTSAPAKKETPSKKKVSTKKKVAAKKTAAKKVPAKKANGKASAGGGKLDQLHKLLSRKDGCAVSEAAEKLDVSEGTVRSMIGALRKGTTVKSLGGGVFKA